MQQYLPLAVLKQKSKFGKGSGIWVATVLTACGIETKQKCLKSKMILLKVATVLTACGIETLVHATFVVAVLELVLQQYLPLAVCDEGCEAAEAQSDDEARTSLVPDQREGKTEVIKQYHLPFTVLKPNISQLTFFDVLELQ